MKKEHEELVRQPTRKVGRGMGVAGVILLVVFALVLLYPEQVPDEVEQALWGLVLLYVIPFVSQYFTWERARSAGRDDESISDDGGEGT